MTDAELHAWRTRLRLDAPSSELSAIEAEGEAAWRGEWAERPYTIECVLDEIAAREGWRNDGRGYTR